MPAPVGGGVRAKEHGPYKGDLADNKGALSNRAAHMSKEAAPAQRESAVRTSAYSAPPCADARWLYLGVRRHTVSKRSARSRLTVGVHTCCRPERGQRIRRVSRAAAGGQDCGCVDGERFASGTPRRQFGTGVSRPIAKCQRRKHFSDALIRWRFGCAAAAGREVVIVDGGRGCGVLGAARCGREVVVRVGRGGVRTSTRAPGLAKGAPTVQSWLSGGQIDLVRFATCTRTRTHAHTHPLHSTARSECMWQSYARKCQPESQFGVGLLCYLRARRSRWWDRRTPDDWNARKDIRGSKHTNIRHAAAKQAKHQDHQDRGSLVLLVGVRT